MLKPGQNLERQAPPAETSKKETTTSETTLEQQHDSTEKPREKSREYRRDMMEARKTTMQAWLAEQPWLTEKGRICFSTLDIRAALNIKPNKADDIVNRWVRLNMAKQVASPRKVQTKFYTFELAATAEDVQKELLALTSPTPPQSMTEKSKTPESRVKAKLIKILRGQNTNYSFSGPKSQPGSISYWAKVLADNDRSAALNFLTYLKRNGFAEIPEETKTIPMFSLCNIPELLKFLTHSPDAPPANINQPSE